MLPPHADSVAIPASENPATASAASALREVMFRIMECLQGFGELLGCYNEPPAPPDPSIGTQGSPPPTLEKAAERVPTEPQASRTHKSPPRVRGAFVLSMATNDQECA